MSQPFALPGFSPKACRGSIHLTLLLSPSSLVLQASKALPFGSSEAAATLCQVPDNTDVKYKQRRPSFSLLPVVNLDFTKACDYIASNAILRS